MDTKTNNILILVMLCNLPQYKEREADIRATWAKDVLDLKYPNIDLWFFTSCEEGQEPHLDVESKIIYVQASDLRDRTFQKLMKAINMINPASYDWIVRVNTSTYLNVNLINKILEYSHSFENLYAGTIFCQPWILGKIPFLSGEYLIVPRPQVEVMQRFYNVNKAYFDKLENDPRKDTKWICDDGWITTCFYKKYNVEKNDWEYSKRIHALGLIYENEEKIEIPPTVSAFTRQSYESFPGICFKTMTEADDNIDLDKNPIHDAADREKLYKIHEIVTSNPQEDLDEWYKWYILNVYDKFCYPYDHVVETQRHKRDMSKAVSKRDIVQWYRFQKKFNKKENKK